MSPEEVFKSSKWYNVNLYRQVGMAYVHTNGSVDWNCFNMHHTCVAVKILLMWETVCRDFKFFMLLCEVFIGANYSFVEIGSSVFTFSPLSIDKGRFLFYFKPGSFENWYYLSLWHSMRCFTSQIVPRISVV